jgi:hypothetical protein
VLRMDELVMHAQRFSNTVFGTDSNPSVWTFWISSRTSGRANYSIQCLCKLDENGSWTLMNPHLKELWTLSEL